MKAKLIIFNIILFVIIIFVFDYLIYQKYKIDYVKQNKERLSIYPPPNYLDFYKQEFSIHTDEGIKTVLNDSGFYRKDTDIEPNKPSILLFGCSFTYGTLLKDNQTFGHKLALKTGRNVYNRALEAYGIQHMYHMLLERKFYENIPNENPPEYAIFVHIPSHLQRTTTYIFPSILSTNGLMLQYSINGYSLEKKKYLPSFLQRSFIVRSIFHVIDNKNNVATIKNKYRKFMLANELFKSSKKILEEKYPDIKFVILNYNMENDYDEFLPLSFMMDVFKSEGFIVLNTEDLVGRKFRYNSEDTVADGYHPSEAAWDLLVPKIVERLNLN